MMIDHATDFRNSLAPAGDPGTERNAPVRILVVDDTQGIHDDIRKILGRSTASDLDQDEVELFGHESQPADSLTFEIDSAYQGQDGLALVQRACEAGASYALAFVDIRMPPGWDGLETAVRMWEVQPDLQLVICSAYSQYSWDDIVARLGRRDNLVILKKPFDAAEVLQLTHSLSQKRRSNKQSQQKLSELETKVNARTLELRTLNEKLVADIARRERAEKRLAAFASLSQRLSAAKTAGEAADIIVNVADVLIGWDACSFHTYSAANNRLRHVLAMDTEEGRRVVCATTYTDAPPSSFSASAIHKGAQLILKKDPNQLVSGGVAFGAKNRPSASILLVPIRDGSRVIGVLSIQSYRVNAYNEESLELLQNLADHCGGALDRIATEEALHAAQNRLSQFLRQSPAVIYSCPSSESNTPDWVSENVAQLIGHTAAECAVEGWGAANVHPGDWARVVEARSQHANETSITIEYRLRHKNGAWRWVRDERRSVTEAGGKPSNCVGTWVDVTAQKELEQQLRQAQKMEAVGQLAGGVAHDFNNLLAVIMGYTELALLNKSELSSEMSESLREVSAATMRATSLTRQLLTFSRKQTLQVEVVNLNSLVENLLKMLHRIIGEDIQLECDLAEGIPPLQADVGMLEQVLVNLVVNARDAMGQGGRLRLQTEKHSFAAGADLPADARVGDFVCLSVSDTGTGISPEHLPHLFEPFFTTKEVGKGTGLGLATVHGIVKQHQGWISVESELQKGSTFRVFLPALGEAQSEKPEATDEPVAKGGNESILLVEDDEALRSLTRHCLEKFGYQVKVARSGREALDLWPEGKFDLLLTDIILPDGINGLDLADQMQSRNPALSSLFISGYSGDALARKQQVAADFEQRLIQKPYKSVELIRRIREALDQRRSPSGC